MSQITINKARVSRLLCLLGALTACLPATAVAKPTGNLLPNASFEGAGGGWSAGGGNLTTPTTAAAPEGTKAAQVNGSALNGWLSLNSAALSDDNNDIAAGTCTFQAQVRMSTATSRSAYLVLRERSGGGVVKQYYSARANLNGTFQKFTVSGDVTGKLTNTVDVSVVVDGVNFWGGDAFAVDATSLVCASLPPLQVHLGDSYSSGAGAGTYPTLNGRRVDESVYEHAFGMVYPCYRTSNNAAQLIAKQLNQRVRDASCGGAATGDITDHPQYGILNQVQINSLTPNAKLVTLSIGGNDILRLNTITCAVNSECTRNSPDVVKAYSLMGRSRDGLRKVLAAITKRAPHAEVRLTNYPYPLPLPGRSSAACGNTISQNEMQVNKDLEDAYSAMQAQVVSEFGPKVLYVDVNAPGSPFNAVDQYGDRSFCSTSPNRWMVGFIDLNLGIPNIGEYHPNATGFAYYAQMYMDTLRGIDSIRG